MINYASFQHNPTMEKIVDVICAGLGTDERSFFRIHVAYYFAVMAATMRCSYHEPGKYIATRPVNCYAVNLAPSGFGKGYSTDVLEEQVINQFRETYLGSTWPILTTHNLSKTADHRARQLQKDPDEIQLRIENDFKRLGEFPFTFTKPTEASIGQLRQKLLMAGTGCFNLQIDEIGANLFKAKDALPIFLELYDGKTKTNLIKNTSEQQRVADMYGITPANIMLFGVPNALLDNGKNEDEFIDMNENGYARRCFFGYVSDEQYDRYVQLVSPAEQLRLAKQANADSALQAISDEFAQLADPLKANIKLVMPDDTALLMFEYKNDCKRRAMELPAAQHIQRYETEHRFTKATRMAAVFAFIESAPEIQLQHLQSAIALAEESGEAFARIMHRDMPHVKLARFLGESSQEFTKVSLRAQLPYFKGGTKQSRDEMLAEAIDWGYTNNIAIKRRFSGGVEFYSGSVLESNDLTKLKISFSQEQAYNYSSQEISWDQMQKLAQVDNIHWINHRLIGGFEHQGHRHNDNCIAGFNFVVLDVDNTDTDYMPIHTAMRLLDGYKAFYYTTKRHAPDHHRYRIILPINYTLELNAEDFEAFMKNLYNWLPFESDEATGQRSRKWMSNNGHSQYTDGILLDALPFIPRTTKQTEYAERLVDLGDLGGIERWFILNTTAGKNRNNNMLRYGYLLADAGMDLVGIRDKVMALNAQLVEPMDESRIDKTIMKTMTKAIQKRSV